MKTYFRNRACGGFAVRVRSAYAIQREILEKGRKIVARTEFSGRERSL